MSSSYRRFFVAVVAAALLLGIPAKAQESADVAVSDMAATDEAASAAVPQSSPAAPDDKWHFAVTPYLWFAGAHGTAGFKGIDASYHASFGDIISKFNIGLMATAEARKERFVFPVDILWMKLSDDEALPLKLPLEETAVTSIKAKLTETIFTPKAGYRVVDQEKIKVDGTIGLRYWHLGENLSLQPINLGNYEAANWVDVVAGARFMMPLSPKAMVMVAGDAGAGGANVDYQVAGVLGYKVKPTIIVQLGWRYLDANYRPSSTFVFDGVTSGIVLGVTFNLK